MSALLLSPFQAVSQNAPLEQSVTLGWNPSPDPNIAGYNVYCGGASGDYTNEVSVGSATNATTSGLMPGVTYYFAVTAYSISGVESVFSGEVAFAVPAPASGFLVSVTPAGQFVLTANGPAGQTYEIQTTQDFQT